MKEDRGNLLVTFEATTNRTIQETSERVDIVHARRNEGNENWKRKFTEVDAKFAELEQFMAHRNSRLEMVQGMVRIPPSPQS